MSLPQLAQHDTSMLASDWDTQLPGACFMAGEGGDAEQRERQHRAAAGGGV